MQLDVISTIHEELLKAMEEGVPLKAFQKNLAPKLQKLGWWGKQDMFDPKTGERKQVQLGSPRRLKTIYRANISSARAAGQWERIERRKKTRPYLRYRLGPSENHRLDHKAQEGLILPVDHPFWRKWYPPNGWGCKCWVSQITEEQAQEYGGVSADPAIEEFEWVNERTGKRKFIPKGIDPGWETNAGINRQRWMANWLAGKLNAARPAIAKTLTQDMIRSWRFKRIHEGSATGSVPVVLLPQALADAVQSPTRVVMVSGETLNAKRKHHGGSIEPYLLVQELLDDGAISYDRPGHARLELVVDGKRWMLAVKVTKNGELLLTTLHRLSERGKAPGGP